MIKNKSEILWTLFGLIALVVACYLLYKELDEISIVDIQTSLDAISLRHWWLAGLSTLGAYLALAWYDRIALMHLGKQVSWFFVAVCSFTTYALAHNIGASMFSGALVRYRAYRTKGLTVSEVGILVVFCSFTFSIGAIMTGAFALLVEPATLSRFTHWPNWTAVAIGLFLTFLVLIYVYGSWRHFKPLDFKGIHIVYPRLPVVFRQLIAGPFELFCAAAIIYFALPEANNPGYLVVLGIFIASFCLALASHAPGGLGVLELAFISAMPDIPKADVMVALLIFRGLYLLLPFAISIVVVAIFEGGNLLKNRRH